MAAGSPERHAETRGRPITPPEYATAVPTKYSSSNHIASTGYVPGFQFSRVLLLPIEADNRPLLPFRQSSDVLRLRASDSVKRPYSFITWSKGRIPSSLGPRLASIVSLARHISPHLTTSSEARSCISYRRWRRSHCPLLCAVLVGGLLFQPLKAAHIPGQPNHRESFNHPQLCASNTRATFTRPRFPRLM